MKNTRYIIPCLASALLLAGCEKQIQIDLEDLEQQVVVRAENEVGSPIAMRLSLSRPAFGSFYVYNDEDYFPAVTDATVTLTVNGTSTETATRDGSTYTLAHIPQPGEELLLTISVPGKENVTATATVPQAPQLGEPTALTRTETVDIDGYSVVNISLFVPLTDTKSGSADYYSLRLTRYDTVVYTYYDNTGAVEWLDTTVEMQSWFECQDQLIVTEIDPGDALEGVAIPIYSGTEMLFNDAYIDGTTHSIELTTNVDLMNYYYAGLWRDDGRGHYSENADGFTYTVHSTFEVTVSALTRDLYLYRQTMNSYSDDELLAFFSEPVQVHSNIEGGIGIFGVKTPKTITYKIDIQP